MKKLGGSYPVLEMVVLRNVVALPFTLLFFRMEGGRGLPKTSHLQIEFIRGIMLFLSYTTAMMGIASLQLAEMESIRFSGPLMITLLSVFFLGERVSWQRWLTLLVGFLGVLAVVRPGSANFNLGSIFILLSVLTYALTVIYTRKLNGADSSATMAYFSSMVYLLAALIVVPFTLAVGDLPHAHPSIAFFFHAWSVPTLLDGFIMCSLGLVWAGWSFFMGKAYSMVQASVAAPFEYSSLPINVTWGYLLFNEIPTLLTVLGAALTLSSGLLNLYFARKQTRKIE